MANIPPSRHSPPDSPAAQAHAPLPHPLTQPRTAQRPTADARSSQHLAPDSHSSSNSHDAGTPAPAFAPGRQPLPRNFPAPPINSQLSKSVADSAALDAATAAITRAGGNLDVGDTGLLDDLCERLSNPELYTRPITRQRIIELLEVCCAPPAFGRSVSEYSVHISHQLPSSFTNDPLRRLQARKLQRHALRAYGRSRLELLKNGISFALPRWKVPSKATSRWSTPSTRTLARLTKRN